MKHDSPPVLAVVGVLGIVAFGCLGVGVALTFKKWGDGASVKTSPPISAFGSDSARALSVSEARPLNGTILLYRAPKE